MVYFIHAKVRFNLVFSINYVTRDTVHCIWPVTEKWYLYLTIIGLYTVKPRKFDLRFFEMSANSKKLGTHMIPSGLTELAWDGMRGSREFCQRGPTLTPVFLVDEGTGIRIPL